MCTPKEGEFFIVAPVRNTCYWHEKICRYSYISTAMKYLGLGIYFVSNILFLIRTRTKLISVVAEGAALMVSKSIYYYPIA